MCTGRMHTAGEEFPPVHDLMSRMYPPDPDHDGRRMMMRHDRGNWNLFSAPVIWATQKVQGINGQFRRLHMRKRNALIGLAIVIVAGGWYAFRPERLFVNRTVN